VFVIIDKQTTNSEQKRKAATLALNVLIQYKLDEHLKINKQIRLKLNLKVDSPTV